MLLGACVHQAQCCCICVLYIHSFSLELANKLLLQSQAIQGTCVLMNGRFWRLAGMQTDDRRHLGLPLVHSFLLLYDGSPACPEICCCCYDS